MNSNRPETDTFSREFLRLIGIAFVLATPLAYFAMQRRLEEFAYRIELGPGVFNVDSQSSASIGMLFETG